MSWFVLCFIVSATSFIGYQDPQDTNPGAAVFMSNLKASSDRVSSTQLLACRKAQGCY